MPFEFDLAATEIPGVMVYSPSVFNDNRGALWSSLTPDINEKFGVPFQFNHVKFATNKKNVLRGIHGDHESWKLVTVISGIIQQVVVDNRIDSPTYKSSLSWTLDTIKPTMILIPPGVGNAFKALSNSIYMYSLAYPDQYNDFDKQFTLLWNDPDFKINWLGDAPILSSRDNHIINS